MEYKDRNGVIVALGDVLSYDEGHGYAQQIHEVVEVDGVLHAVTRIGEPFWSVIEDDRTIDLMFYQNLPYTDGVLVHALVIGKNTDDSLMTIEKAQELFPYASTSDYAQMAELEEYSDETIRLAKMVLAMPPMPDTPEAVEQWAKRLAADISKGKD